MRFMVEGGPFMWLLLVIGVLVLVLAVWAGSRLRRADGPDPMLETGIDAVLFWGGWGVVVGLLGTFVGIYQAAGAISRAGEVAPAVIWGGIRVALTTTLFGLLIFAVAGLIWMGLRVTYGRRLT